MSKQLKSDSLIIQTIKYKDIVEDMKSRISEGTWVENQVIPTERALATYYETSRTTIRKAIDYLKQRGYLHSEHGRGNFVLPERSRENNLLHSFTNDIQARGGKPNQEILEMGYYPLSEVIRTSLELPTTLKTIFKIKRLRFFNTTPMGIQTAYIPLKENQSITEEELLAHGSLYGLLEEKLNIRPLEAYESISARLPSSQERNLLELSHDDAVLCSTRVTLSVNRIPMEYVEMIYPANRYSYKIKITKDSFNA